MGVDMEQYSVTGRLMVYGVVVGFVLAAWGLSHIAITVYGIM